MLKDGLILSGTVEEIARWRLWRHDYDVMVMWRRHQWRHHSTARGCGHFPVCSQ